MADGSRHSTSYVLETIAGVTPATPVFKKVRTTGVTLSLSKDTLSSEEASDDRQVTCIRGGAYSIGGGVDFELSTGTFDDWIEAVLQGTWTANVVNNGIKRRSFTIERNFQDLLAADNPFHRFVGCEFNTWSLSISANKMVTGSWGILGANMSTAGAIVTGATYTDAPTSCPVDSFTGVLKEGGAPIAVATEIQLNIDNGMQTRYVIGSRASLQPSNGNFSCTGTFTAYFENSTLLNKFINETESSIEISLPNALGKSYTILLPRVIYTGGQPDVKGAGPITLQMPFQATKDPVSGKSIKITRVP